MPNIDRNDENATRYEPEESCANTDHTPRAIDPDAWKKMCPVELMAGNEQLAEWANHWEQRALKAERLLQAAEGELPDIDAALEYPHCFCDVCDGTRYLPAVDAHNIHARCAAEIAKRKEAEADRLTMDGLRHAECMRANAAGARVRELEAALRSIAANTCCDTCREAALVASAVLLRDQAMSATKDAKEGE